MLLEEGATINHVNIVLDSPLMVACSPGHLSVVELLLQDDKCDIFLENNFGQTAIELASAWTSSNHQAIVVRLEAIKKVVLQKKLEEEQMNDASIKQRRRRN